MILLRLSSSLTLWGSAAALCVCAVMTATQATALDARRPSAWLWIPVAFAIGHVLRLVAGDRQARFSLDHHALTLIVAACAGFGLAHVDGHTSLTTLREAVPPALTFLYPALVIFTPWLLSRTAARHDVAEQTLLVALGLTTLDGALCLLPAPAGVALAASALATQLSSGTTTISFGRSRATCWMCAFFVAMTIATAFAGHRLDAQSAWSWILAMTLLGVTVALRKRTGDGWRRLLAAPTLVAALVAVCTAIAVGVLADAVSLESALGSRLTMFRQHPNFLAPFFGLHATLALGLALAARGLCRLGWGGVALLLAAATLHTDSNAGRAALLLGFVLVPGAFIIRKVVPRIPRVVLATIAVLAVGGSVALGALLIQSADASTAGTGSGLDRVARSLDYRLDAWRNSAAVIASSPWIGVGPNTNLSMFAFEPGSRYFNEPTPPHPHNVLLYITQAGGLLALAAALGWLVTLLAGHWKRFASASEDDDVPAVLVASVLAGCAVLAVANALDLGLSLMTVMPAPLFALTGLLANHRERPWTPRIGPAALVTLALLLVTASTAWRPLWARMRSAQAQLHLFDTNFAIDRTVALPNARRMMAKAVSLDPTIHGAHELLARWLESTEQGFHKAHDQLQALIELTPVDSRSHSLLAQLYKRNGMYRQAADAYATSLAAPRGHSDRSRDRADRIWCLAQEGEREAALIFLVEAMRLDRGVIQHIPWKTDAAGRRSLPIRAGGQLTNLPPLRLEEAAEQLFARHADDELNGRPVGRRFWMDTYNAFRDAKRDDRALVVLEAIQRTEPGVLAGEPWTLDNERGKIALDAGDTEGAYALFMAAYDKTVASGNPNQYFKTQAAKARSEPGEDIDEDDARPPTTLATIGALGQILDMHPYYTDHFRASADAQVAAGNARAAADDTHRLLIFTDDVLERAKLLERTAALLFEAGEHEQLDATIADALDHLAAKPFPSVLLQRDEYRSLPGDLARLFVASLGARGLTPDAMREHAWRLPHFFASRTGPSLFRLEFLQATGQVDGLLKEAELMLLVEPDSILGQWAHVTALEAMGRFRESDFAMRALAETFGQRHSVERLINQIAADSNNRADDASNWQRVAVLKLLQGYFSDSAGLFARGREHAKGNAALEAELAQWQSRALLYAGRTSEARDALADAVNLAPERPMLARRLEVMP